MAQPRDAEDRSLLTPLPPWQPTTPNTNDRSPKKPSHVRIAAVGVMPGVTAVAPLRAQV
jgi:hypothetical protein